MNDPRLVINLEKGRPALPEGTRRKHWQNRGGKRVQVWVKKLGKKWVYDGMVGTKKDSKNVGKRSRVRKEWEERNKKVDEEIEWLVGDVPSRDYVIQEAKKELTGKLDAVQKKWLNEHLDEYGFANLDELSKEIVESVVMNAEWREVVGDLADRNSVKVKDNGETLRAFRSLKHFTQQVERAKVLSNPNFDGKMDIRGTYVKRHGMHATINTNVGPFGVTVPYDQVEEFYDAWAPDRKSKDIRRLKTERGYKEWQIRNDPKIVDARRDFQKMTGLMLETQKAPRAVGNFGWLQTSGRALQLKAEYIKKVTKVFKAYKAGFDIKKFKPDDGVMLKVRIEGLGKGIAGFYSPGDAILTISPKQPGVVSHEMGHYLWERGGKALEIEFMTWAEESGLLKRIKNAPNVGRTPAERKLHVDSTFNHIMKRALTMFGDNGVPDDQIKTSENLNHTATRGLQLFSNILRMKLGESSDAGEWEVPMRKYQTMTEGDLYRLAQAHQDKFPGEDVDTLANRLIAFKKGFEKLNLGNRNTLASYLAVAVDASTRLSPQGQHYKDSMNYYAQPTEIFARTFRNYLAMKAGQPIYDTMQDQFNKEPKAMEKSPHGHGIPEVDPTKEILEFDDNRLQALLKKHFGDEVVKAMALVFALDKSLRDFQTQGEYKVGDPVSFDPDELAMGIKHEMEHTDDPAIAEEIAKDHLAEDPQYYTNLAQIEKADDDEDEEEEEMSERDKEFEREQKNEEARDAKKSVRLVVALNKGQSYPEGTIRKHGGRTMVKKDGGWVPAAEGKASETKEEKDRRKSRKTSQKKDVLNRMEGSPQLLDGLNRVANGDGPLLDDLDGDDRKLFNAMTRAKLVTWVHMAQEEYRPELTDSGKKALADGLATSRKHERAAKKEKKKRS